MISFALTDADVAILGEARAQADLASKYARDFEHDEDRMLPHAFPEAEGRPDTRAMLASLASETSGLKILHALLYLEDWRGGVPLRESVIPSATPRLGSQARRNSTHAGAIERSRSDSPSRLEAPTPLRPGRPRTGTRRPANG